MAIAARPWVVGTSGPVDLAVRLWRQWLLAVLQRTGGAGRPRPGTAAEARDAVAAHAAEVAAETDRLVRAFAQVRSDVLKADALVARPAAGSVGTWRKRGGRMRNNLPPRPTTHRRHRVHIL